MMTTDLELEINKIYSAAYVYTKLQKGYGTITRSSVHQQVSLNSIKRAISTKWARTAINKLYPNIEFGGAYSSDDITTKIVIC